MAGEWTLIGETEDEVRRLAMGGRFDIDDESYCGFIEESRPRPGVILSRMAGEIRYGLDVFTVDDQPLDSLAFLLHLDGGNRAALPGVDPPVRIGSGDIASFRTAERSAHFALRPHPRMRAVALSISPDALDDMMGGRPLPSSLAAAHPFADIRPMSVAARRIAAEIMDPDYAGHLGHLYREAKLLELLAVHLGAYERTPGGARELSPRELRMVYEARDRLVADLARPPSLHRLAEDVRLDARKLNRGFRQLFGTTVFDYLRETRMERARLLLQEGEMPVKEIAWRVGYRQASNFTTAYRRKFGVPPARHAQARS